MVIRKKNDLEVQRKKLDNAVDGVNENATNIDDIMDALVELGEIIAQIEEVE